MMPAVIALLGPTNTGKTHLALQRMLEHRTGMIGFPLRLLARENYDRVVRLRGAESVALITGEERIVPACPAYFICTVEAMPLDQRVDFLAVDEVQLAADRERGHVFTQRVLEARGSEETMLLGADTIAPLLQRLLPQAGFRSRPRLSTLRYVPPCPLARLPRRSAVVAFSLAGVYSTAERLRRERGGVAVVFGALSPRTRNAQVALYQAGEVDYLVATDAIGMGLNLDIDHVFFTGLHKFDGVGPRPLAPAEVAQIAGRAGRHTRDGTFGATAELGAFEPQLVTAIEDHHFASLQTLQWRNSALWFDSPAALLRSLERRPTQPGLTRIREPEDQRALAALLQEPDVQARARDRTAVELLWDVCQVPDFRKILTDAHARLLLQLYRHLTSVHGRLPEDWIAAQVTALDRLDGDIESLLFRLEGIRTWTYVAHRSGWLADPPHWRGRTRAVEDRLSDALHERLTEQFVDRRATVIARQEPSDLLAQITDTNEVLIQGLRAGQLQGFRFVADAGIRESARPLLAAANRALRAEVDTRVSALVEDSDTAFTLTNQGQIVWRGAPVARLTPGDQALAPQLEVLPSELVDPPRRERVRKRLAAWLDARLRQRLPALFTLRDGPLGGPARGLAFALAEALGALPRRDVSAQLALLSPHDRRAVGRLGVTLGRLAVYLSWGLDQEIALRGLLWSLRQDRVPGPTPDGRIWFPAVADGVAGFLGACGYQRLGPWAIRVDRLERFAGRAFAEARQAPVQPNPSLAVCLGCDVAELTPLLQALGMVERSEGFVLRRSREAAAAHSRR